jgi:hypothetical protein
MKKILLYLWMMISSTVTFASYQMSIVNVQQISASSYQFDVMIKSTAGTTIITSYQCALKIPSNIINNGTLSFAYSANSSQLRGKPTVSVSVVSVDENIYLTFGSMPDLDSVKNNVLVGRFILQNSVSFAGSLNEITWNFDGNINTILTGINFANITNPANHLNYLSAFQMLSAELLDANKLQINFSNELNSTISANKNNYSVNNGIIISAASLINNNKSIVLTTSNHTSGFTYIVTAVNIKDVNGNALSSANTLEYLYVNSVSANLKIFLEGAYKNNEMRTDLRNQNFLPLSQPYNNSAFQYSGTEAVDSLPLNVVDWVLVELRNTASGSAIAKRAAFLRKDGIVVDLNGNDPVKFHNVNKGSYYIIIKHRNHLGVMTSNKIEIDAVSSLYDFTTSSNKAYGSSAMKNIGGGVFALFSGDGNSSANVNNADANSVWKQENGSIGYKAGDFDLNGGVNIVDKNSYWKSNSGKSSQIP